MTARAPSIGVALAGRQVMVTRPAAQSTPLARGIEAEGGQVLLFPLLDIAPAGDDGPVRDIAGRLDGLALAVFVSANAVRHGLAALRRYGHWPDDLLAATVGRQSEQALRELGVSRVVAPRERFDSEALLGLPELSAAAVGGRRVAIFRGDGGRELLGEELARRGARVDYVSCYRRLPPPGVPEGVRQALRAGRIDAVTLTSSEALRHLPALFGDTDLARLKVVPLLVPHERIASLARDSGFLDVHLTGASDEGLLAGLKELFGHTRSP